MAAVTGVAGVAAACAAPTQAPAPTAAPTQATAPTKAPAPTNTTAPTAVPTVKKTKVLNLGVNVGPTAGFNPLSQTGWFDLSTYSIMNALVAMPDAERSQFVPDLAESWTTAPDGSSMTFKIQKNAKWHDGVPVTAKDLQFTWTMGLRPDTKSNKVGGYSLIKGGKDFNTGKADKVTGITILDEKTIKVDFESPSGLFLNELALRAAILPEHILGKTAPADFPKSKFATEAPLGCGPFKFVKYVPDQYIEFEANPDFWRGRPKVDRIVLNIIKSMDTLEVALTKGEIMMAFNDGGPFPIATYKKFAGDPNFKVVATREGPILGYGFNFRNEALKDPKLHQAFLYAMDRRKIVDSFLGGIGTIPNAFMDHQFYKKPEWAGLYPYDPAKAKSLLQEIKWDSNREIKVNILPIANEDDRAILAAQQQMLGDVGIKVKFQELEVSVWVEQFYNEPHAFEVAYVTYGIWADPDGFLYWHMHSTSKNAFGYANPTLDAKIEAGRKAIDKAARTKIYQEIAEEMLQSVPLAPAFRQNMLWMHNKKLALPGTETMLALKPDFKDLGPGRSFMSAADCLLYMPDQWDLKD